MWRALLVDFKTSLWLLKLGALVNVYFLLRTAVVEADPYIVVPARIFFAVSAYRCLFPVRYEHYVVLHDSVWSSVFATRVFATFAEVAYIPPRVRPSPHQCRARRLGDRRSVVLSPRILALRGRLAAALADEPWSDQTLREALDRYRAIGATGHAERLAQELNA